MKRRLLLLIGTLITLAIATSLVISVASAAQTQGNHFGPPAKITWSQKVVTETMAPGDTMTVSVTFTSTKDITAPVLSIRPKHSTLVQVSDFPTSIVANTPYTITLSLSGPTDTTRAAFNSKIFVRSGRTLAWPLAVRVKVTQTETPVVNPEQ